MRKTMEQSAAQEPRIGHLTGAGATHPPESRGEPDPMSARRRMVSLLLYQREQGKEFPGEARELPAPGERIRLTA